MARIDDLREAVNSKFTLVHLAAKRAREINDYYVQLGEGLGQHVPPLVSIDANKPLSIAMEEIAQQKIEEGESGQYDEAGEDPLAFIGDDGREYDLFGRGGAEMLAQQLALPFLGAVPINMNLRRHCDAGDPTANFTNDSQLAEAFTAIAQNVQRQITLVRQSQSAPTLTVR